MKQFTFLIFVCLLALQFAGCNSANPNRTYRGNLIDDKVTSQRVQAALNRAGPDFNQIQVSTDKGVVTLTGSVKNEQERARAEQIVRADHRVTDLKDDLQVRQ